MFAGFGTGGIPGSGSDRSATGLATGQVSGALEAERTGAALLALEWGVRAGAGTGGCDVGQKTSTPAAITAATATDPPPNHTVRRDRQAAGQPTLPIACPPLHNPAGRRSSRPGARGVRDRRRRRLPAPRSGR